MSTLLDAMRAYPEILQACGVLGSILYVGGFALVQTGKICGNGALYPCNQLTAATLVLISLVGAFNLGAFLIQVGFLFFGAVGLARRLRMRWQGRYPEGTGISLSRSNGPSAPVPRDGLPESCDSETHPPASAHGTQVRYGPAAAAPAP